MQFYNNKAEFEYAKNQIRLKTGRAVEWFQVTFYQDFEERILEKHLTLKYPNIDLNVAHVWVESDRKSKKSGRGYSLAHVVFDSARLGENLAS